MRKLRWGILGAAKIAIEKVIPPIQKSERGVVTALATRDVERGRKVAAQLGIASVHAGYQALLADPDIDAVYIPLPNHLHAEWTIAAARAGKHVLCEKPLALSAREAETMIGAARKSGREADGSLHVSAASDVAQGARALRDARHRGSARYPKLVFLLQRRPEEHSQQSRRTAAAR